jgi:hypothetical protein
MDPHTKQFVQPGKTAAKSEHCTIDAVPEYKPAVAAHTAGKVYMDYTASLHTAYKHGEQMDATDKDDTEQEYNLLEQLLQPPSLLQQQ